MKQKFHFSGTYLFSFAILLFTFSSCSVLIGGGDRYNKKMVEVQLGMTQSEVITILGDKYVNQGVYQSPEGQMNTIYYKADTYLYYYFYFLDNHLVEWTREYDSDSAARNSAAMSEWHREQDRKRAFEKMQDLKEREVKALEKANEKK